jgi:flagellar biosynthesis protein FlhG
MRDFYTSSGSMPLDQADGLRRLFGARRQRVIPLVANPHLAFVGVALEQVAEALVAQGRRVLVVDAADGSPPPHEMAAIDLTLCIDALSSDVWYLAARGLPLAFVDTRGSAGGFLDTLALASPQADVVLLHANATDLARIFARRAARPLLLAADHPESVKHAYAACKLLARRCELMTFDLLLLANPSSVRVPSIAASLAGCADGFLGAVLHDWAAVDPAADADDGADPALARLLAAQLMLDDLPDTVSHARASAAPRHAMKTN